MRSGSFSMAAFIDLTGNVYNRLTVIGIHHRERKKIYWLCDCICGQRTIATSHKMKSGHTQSCGCYQLQRIRETATKHGMRHTRIFNIWAGIKQRCSDKKLQEYKNYGGRGINMCKEWADSFIVFNEWAMTNGYEEHLSIDRKDNDGNYEPNNCRWATIEQQSFNKRETHRVNINGEILNTKQIFERYGINRNRVYEYAKRGVDFNIFIEKWNLKLTPTSKKQ